LAASVVQTSLAYADHDEIAYPPPQSTANKLQPIPDLDRTGITVSGLSSGGFFAHQFHIAVSSLVHGVGIIAGGPFGCVENIKPLFLVLVCASGSGLSGHGSLHALLWKLVLRAASCRAESN
jgi:poly(3-hydroxybutyrate) depolymerase